MNITTKFNVGDRIAYIDVKNMRIKEDIVDRISIYSPGLEIFYSTEKGGFIEEKYARASRDEILESLNRPF